jgi:hypothetical protein
VVWSPVRDADLVLRNSSDAVQLRLAVRARQLRLVGADRVEPMPLTDGEVRLVLDGPVVEIFAGGGAAAHVLPAPAAWLGVEADGGATSGELVVYAWSPGRRRHLACGVDIDRDRRRADAQALDPQRADG